MKAGIKSNLIFRISPVVRMELIMSRLFVFRSMPTVGKFAELGFVHITITMAPIPKLSVIANNLMVPFVIKVFAGYTSLIVSIPRKNSPPNSSSFFLLPPVLLLLLLLQRLLQLQLLLLLRNQRRRKNQKLRRRKKASVLTSWLQRRRQKSLSHPTTRNIGKRSLKKRKRTAVQTLTLSNLLKRRVKRSRNLTFS